MPITEIVANLSAGAVVGAIVGLWVVWLIIRGKK